MDVLIWIIHMYSLDCRTKQPAGWRLYTHEEILGYIRKEILLIYVSR